MHKHYISLMLVKGITTLLMAGCIQKTEPEGVYQVYYDACVNGNFDKAKLYLADSAIEASKSLGVCTFTHDAINTREVQKGNPTRTFSKEPIVNTHENISQITWIDNHGNLVTVTLNLIGGNWKIANTTWSY